MTSLGLMSLPVAMYHYVCDWRDSIAVTTDTFEEHLAAMRQAGFRGIPLSEAIAFMLRGAPMPTGSVLLTFDDGYLDNYVYAYPLLKKHGHHGVIFGVTSKIDAAQKERSKLFPTLEDVESGRYKGPNPPARGKFPLVDEHEIPSPLGGTERRDHFISWREAKVLEDSGVMNVAAHTHTHTSVFTGPNFKGFHKPEHRTRTFDRVTQPIIHGLPRFDLGPALACRAFVPSEKLYALVRSIVPQDTDGALAFFADPANERRLNAELAKLPRSEWGAIESPEDFRKRAKEELGRCQESFRAGLGHDARVLAWPWGKYNQAALTVAKELGFDIFFAVSRGANERGRNYDHIHRFKAKCKSGSWFVSRLRLYSSPWKAKIYAMLGR